jgi:hypothetical protein
MTTAYRLDCQRSLHNATHRPSRRSRSGLSRDTPGKSTQQCLLRAERPACVQDLAVRKRSSLTIGRTHGRYAQLQNRGHDWSGHFWANRFYSTPLDNRHLLAAVKYIELNPVRAGFVERVEEYEWSSARSHALGVEDTLLSSFRPFPSMVGDWSRFLASGLEQETLQKLRENTSTGRPTGSEAFIAVLEARLGRTLACQRRGPKPREQLSQEGEDDRAKG